MSLIGEIKRRLEATVEAIEALDADLAAGRLDRDEHHRRQAEHEREGGRLFVSLRRAQREAGGRPTEPPAVTAGRRGGGLRSPSVIVAVGVLLLVAGVGAGMVGARWLGGRPGSGAPVAAPAASAGGPSVLMGDIELRALRQAAAREDTPIASLLELAHTALDQGRIAEARDTYRRVLAREPRNVEAITHLGAVAYQEGRVDEALAKVDEALRIDPGYIHAHWDRTQYLFYGKRDFPGVVRAGEAFLRVLPKGADADSVRRLMAEAQAQTAKPRSN